KTIAARYERAQTHTLGGSLQPAAETGEAPARRPWLKTEVALVLLAAIVASAAVLLWKPGALSAGREQSLAYSLPVQKMRDGTPFQGEFESSGQEIFENGWK